jgi:hypothetical protein
VFPARYELNSYIVFRKRLVSKRLSKEEIIAAALPSAVVLMFTLVTYRCPRLEA